MAMHRAEGRSVSWHGQQARVQIGTTDNDEKRATVTPESADHPLTAEFVRRCLDTLRAEGVASVDTPALTESDAHGFVQAGFTITARLHLLTHDLLELPRRGSQTTRRAAAWTRRHDLLTIDGLAFAPNWRLDEVGLGAALAATPVVRSRISGESDDPTGYAISGRAGRRGYLQRLAVRPDAQGRGHGRALVYDCLAWCRRWRVHRVVVNTHEGNDAAVRLYRTMGFLPSPLWLVVAGYRDGASPPRYGADPDSTGRADPDFNGRAEPDFTGRGGPDFTGQGGPDFTGRARTGEPCPSTSADRR